MKNVLSHNFARKKVHAVPSRDSDDDARSSRSSESCQSLQISTADGRLLAATYYAPRQSNATVAVLINSAFGVPRLFYDAFAQHLSGHGLAVLTYDYRGMGGSRAAEGGLDDWGRQDLPAALLCLASLHPTRSLTLVCHSVGGQILGLAENIGNVRAAVLVASQSGHWRHWRGLGKARMALLWWVFMPVSTALLGRFPGRWFGAADAPAAVARVWARWGRSRHYVCDDQGRALRPFNHLVRFPIRWLSFTDDSVAPFEAVEALRAYYPQARQQRLHLAPTDVGAASIGHFGFFRRTTPVAQWDELAIWLSRSGSVAKMR